MSPLLEVSGLNAWHGPSQVLRGVSFTVAQGEVVALMGRNGMGKTTAISAICGMLPHRSGKVIFAGENLTGLPSFKIARLGIGLVPEGRRCFASLSVRENLMAAARPGPWTLKRVQSLFPGMESRLSQSAGTLSGGEQQMLSIGRALMTNPKLIILDEATEGLAPVVRHEIWAAIDTLKSEGLSILLVDKTLGELLRVASRCVVLEKGRTCWQGPPGGLTPDLADRYLGVGSAVLS
jgi:branched-chain amino acid transport system ATP-binding protein